VSVTLFRIDDRLIHGQVVVGWGQPLGIDFIVLVDDEVRSSDWEQELYRMGVPPQVSVEFASVEEAIAKLPAWMADGRQGIVLTGSVEAMLALCAGSGGVITGVNLGGIHHREGRKERLRYVYLTDREAEQLRELEGGGVRVTAQDVPTAKQVSLEELLG
jgi:PTS system mannose-specific IIB component/fructoselysine and glucoselysine-specific PTS system IIB component